MPLVVNLTELAVSYFACPLTDCFGNSAISTSATDFNTAKGIRQMEALN